MKRGRNTKIVATLGPATTTKNVIEELYKKGADVFRLNFSHGTHEDHKQRYEHIREIEKENGRPIGILMDLQGPKLRVGTFLNGQEILKAGKKFVLDSSNAPGDNTRVHFPHPEIMSALKKGTTLLIDDGRITLKVTKRNEDSIETEVVFGGTISDRKGVNVPNVFLPLSPLTTKDWKDLKYGLSLGADWVALSFVQQGEDVLEAKKLIKGRAKIISKIEKPLAVEKLSEIIKHSDAIMIARGDLGVEIPPEEVPVVQKKIIHRARAMGKPVIVATQMLDSMVASPTPTRAEATDVATAVYEGADAVMLSAETASGKYPGGSVAMMDKIIKRVENDVHYWRFLATSVSESTIADAISGAVKKVTDTIGAPVIITYSESGSTTCRVARERARAVILSLTPFIETARQLTLVWGTHSVCVKHSKNIERMAELACHTAYKEKLAKKNQFITFTAGVPFRQAGTTNMLRIETIKG